MIELKDNEKLYYIENEGCDDTTKGLAIITDEEFPRFKEIIENLNKNSVYGCMPEISVYKIDVDLVKEATEDCDDDDMLYLRDKIYEKRDGIILWQEGERII